jgi:ATP-dependent DNA helicase RecG
MNLESLHRLAAQGESERLEFKTTTGQRTEAMKTVCAMLNGMGGFVLFGVTDKGEVRGQECSARTLEDIANELYRIEPPAFPDIETVNLENGKTVIALRISGRLGGGPYTYDGWPYLRQGPTTRLMPRERYERLLLEYMHGTRRWENQPAQSISIDDLDHRQIILTIEEAIRRGRLEDPNTRDIPELLTGLGLIHEGSLLNAAVVLFAKADKFLPLYPQCVLRMARFRGLDKTEFIDNRQEHGHAFELLTRAQRFMRDHLPIAGRIVPSLFERIDDPLYPPLGLREAVANAICHRDYSIGGGAISVAIYDDRLEISSTGVLPFDIKPEDLLRPHRSRPWNPFIAHTFYRRGIIEQWGRGTLKIKEWNEQAGIVPPEFAVESGEVVVCFRPTRYIAPTRVSTDLSDLQQQLLNILAQTGPAPLGVLRQHLPPDTPRRTVQNNLAILRLLGLVDFSGKGIGARWRLKARNRRPSDY